MKDIFNKIYSERNPNVNFALIITSLVLMIVYKKYIQDYVLLILIFIFTFSFVKIILYFLSMFVKKYSTDRDFLDSFSDSEKEIMKKIFIDNKSTFISLNEVEKIKVNNPNGLHSLKQRGIIRWIEGGFGEGPSGFLLDDYVYKVIKKKLK